MTYVRERRMVDRNVTQIINVVPVGSVEQMAAVTSMRLGVIFVQMIPVPLDIRAMRRPTHAILSSQLRPPPQHHTSVKVELSATMAENNLVLVSDG